jgi:heat shock protein HslJ
MKNAIMVVFCMVLALPLITSCADTANTRDSEIAFRDSGTTFGEVEGKEWKLMEVVDAGKTVSINREKLEADNMGGFYTIKFQDGQVGGIGAPNRYFGPYTAMGGGVLNIGALASTLMANLIEPDGLKEHEYFSYLSNVTRWDIRKERLELRSKNSNSTETVLIFDQK